MANEPAGTSETILFQTEDGRTRIEVQYPLTTPRLSDESRVPAVWEKMFAAMVQAMSYLKEAEIGNFFGGECAPRFPLSRMKCLLVNPASHSYGHVE